MYSRGREHLRLFSKKDQASAMWEHCKSAHGSQRVEFSMQQTGSFTKPLARQVTKAIQIKNFKGKTFNLKSEWRLPALARPVYSRELQDQ